MSTAVLIVGLFTAALAVVCSIRVAPLLREIATRGKGGSTPGELNRASRLVWCALLSGTVAGASSAWEGDAVLSLVWLAFAALQCSNFSALATARPAPPAHS
jgi:hypothetical protein